MLRSSEPSQSKEESSRQPAKAGKKSGERNSYICKRVRARLYSGTLSEEGRHERRKASKRVKKGRHVQDTTLCDNK